MRNIKNGQVLDAGLGLAAAVAIVFCTIFVLQPIDQLSDIIFTDDSAYLMLAHEFRLGLFSEPEWSPLYSLWLYLQGLFISDPVTWFMANAFWVQWFALTLVALTVFRFTASFSWTLLCLLLLAWSGFLQVNPYISYFTVIVMMVGINACLGLRSWGWQLLGWCCLAFAMIFVRPEYYLSFLLAAIGLVCCWLLSRKGLVADAAVPKLAWAALLVMLVVLANMSVLSGERSWWAFAQHYAHNMYDYGRAGSEPADYLYRFQPIAQQAFGDARSMPAALLANPAEFFWHIGVNISSTLSLCWGKARQMLQAAPGLLFLSLLVFYFMYISVKRARASDRFSGEPWRAGWFALIFLAPTLVSLVIIFVRPHYVLVPVLLAPVLVSMAMGQLRLQGVYRQIDIGLCFALLAVCLLQGSPVIPSAQPQAKTVAAIRALDTEHPVGVLFEAEFGWCFYLPGCEKSYYLWTKAPWQLSELDSILLTPALRGASGLRPDVRAIIDAPAKHGFVVLPVNSNTVLLNRPRKAP